MMSFLKTFQSRHHEEELMDLPETGKDDFIRALEEIRWVNRRLGGTHAILTELTKLILKTREGVPLTSQERVGAGPVPAPHKNKNSTFKILDLGTASADIPIALVQWARQHRIAFEITAVDLHPTAIETARKATENLPEITVMQGDALSLPFADQSFDFVISSMTMHHLRDDEAIRLLREMVRMSRRALLVNDLERHPLAWLGIRSLGILTGKGKVFRNDAPLSVLRGFTRSELEALGKQAGLTSMRLHHWRPYRWVLVWTRT